jgi:hypothetical protein
MLAVDLYYSVFFFSRVTDCICLASTLLRSSYCFFPVSSRMVGRYTFVCIAVAFSVQPGLVQE